MPTRTPAVARPAWDFEPADRQVAAIGRALAGNSDRARGPRWMASPKVAGAAGLKGARFADAVARSEAAGLLEREERDSGTWLRPSRLGASLFDAREGPGLKVVPAEPGNVPDVDEVLAELASIPSAVVLAEDLAGRMAVDVMDLWEALEAAQAGGWADLWPDAPQGPCAVLSALSAARLGLVLSSVRPDRGHRPAGPRGRRVSPTRSRALEEETHGEEGRIPGPGAPRRRGAAGGPPAGPGGG